MKKKITMVVLCLIVAFGCTLPIQATPLIHEEEVAPKMIHLSTVFCGINIKNGLAYVQGNYSIYEALPVTLTVTLQKSSDNSAWSSVQTWSQTRDKIGTNFLERSRGGLTKNWYYRSAITVRVKNAQGQTLEYITKQSPSWRY